MVPPDSRYSALGGSSASLSTYAPPTAPNAAYVPITTSDDSSGARAGAPNLRCDCRIPYSTTASPYSSTCGAKTISILAPTPVSGPRGQPAEPESSAETIGCAASASAALTGTSSSTVQVSRADAICLAVAPGSLSAARGSPAVPSSAVPSSPGLASTAPASTGTTTDDSAPPSTMS